MPRTRLVANFVLAALLLTACDRSGAPPRPRSAPAPTLASVPLTSSASAVGSAAAPTAPASETTPFHLVATGDDLDLFPMGSETFATIGCAAGGPFASVRLVGNGIELSTALTEGWSLCPFCVCNFQGSWPDHLYREAPGAGDGCTTQALQVKKGKTWKSIGGPGGGEIRVASWSRERRIAAGQNCGGLLTVSVFDKKDREIQPRDAPKLTGLDLPNLPGRPGPMLGFAAFPSGEVYLLLGRLEAEPAWLAVWRDGKPKAVVHPLEQTKGEADFVDMVAAGPREVYAAFQLTGAPLLARFDGASWKPVTVSGPRKIALMRSARDGGIWIADGDARLWHMSPDGKWSSLLLPVGFKPTNVVEVAPGDVWVSSSRELHHNRPVAQPLKIVTQCPGVFSDGSDDQSLEKCNPRLER